MAGEADAVDDAAKRGWALFNGRAGCNVCHPFDSTSPLFSDQVFYNIGIAAKNPSFTELAHQAALLVDSSDQRRVEEMALQSKFSELGRFLVTKQSFDTGKLAVLEATLDTAEPAVGALARLRSPVGGSVVAIEDIEEVDAHQARRDRADCREAPLNDASATLGVARDQLANCASCQANRGGTRLALW